MSEIYLQAHRRFFPKFSSLLVYIIRHSNIYASETIKGQTIILGLRLFYQINTTASSIHHHLTVPATHPPDPAVSATAQAGMMLLAAQPQNHHFEHRRQHPSEISTATAPDLTFSPALSDYSVAPEDGGLASQFNDILALSWDPIATSPTPEPASPYMHGYHLGGAPYRAPPRSTSQQSHTRSQGVEAGSNLNPHNWQSFGNPQHQPPPAAHNHLSQSRPTSRFGGQLSGHKRNHSGSTVTSTGPASPFTPIQTYPHIHDPEVRYPSPLLDNFDLAQQNLYSKPVASSTTTFSDTFYQPQYQQPNYHADPNLAYQAAMRRAMMQPETDPPVLPRQQTGEFDGNFGATLDARGQSVPKLRRSLSNIYQDELYDPTLAQPATAPLPSTHRTPVQPPSGSQSASPRGGGGGSNEMFTQLLAAANNGHLSASDSPSDASRERSPFQPTSEYAPNRMQSAAQMRQQRKAVADAYAYAQHQARASPQEEPKTISPKDAFLDASEVDSTDYSAAMMFPPMTAVSAGPMTGPVLGSQMAASRRPMATGGVATLQRQGSSQRSSSTQQTPVSTSTPEFRAPLVSMESTHSEGGVEGGDEYAAPLSSSSSQPSSQASSSSGQRQPLRRPSHTTADSGTYTCTYHNCSQRFETAAKLQKHKRDVHRPVSPNATGDDEEKVHSPRTTAAMLAARNSQAGPHRCARINPGTGRPCNSVFSRPYDLTRHEDTIHNSRKHKVRCPFCAEEKTFSRADALTRHLRVVHPEKDVPGRRRRVH